MAKLLVVEGSNIVKGVFQSLLEKEKDFNYELVSTYAETKALLQNTSYEYAVVERVLSDAPKGEIIALLNKHNIAPLLFTKEIDEEFFDSFEGAQIVDYIVKHKYNNITSVVQRLKQLKSNKETTVLIMSKTGAFSSYLKQNLNLHSFKVLNASSNEEAFKKIDLHPEISLVISDEEDHDLAIELVTKIRYYKESSKIKILQIVKETNSFLTSNILSAGANDFLVKPFSRHEFYTRIYQNITTIA